jgi:outer membrane protein assembly factor BamB
MIRALAPLALLAGLGGCDRTTATTDDGIQIVWRAAAGGGVTSVPARAGGLVIATYFDQRVRAHDFANGQLRWTSADLGGAVFPATPIVAGETIIITRGTELLGLRLEDGVVSWRRRMLPDSSALPNEGGALELRVLGVNGTRDKVAVPAWGSTITVIEPPTGQTLWSWQRGPPHVRRHGANGALWCGNDVYGSLWQWVDENGTRSRHILVALDATTGALRWSSELPFEASGVAGNGQMACSDSLLFAATLSGPLWALDRQSGEVVWRIDRPPGFGNLGGPALIGSTVVADNGAAASLIGVRAADGARQWETRVQMVPGLLMTAGSQQVWVMFGGALRVVDGVTGALRFRRNFNTMRSPAGPLIVRRDEVIAATEQGLVRFKLPR